MDIPNARKENREALAAGCVAVGSNAIVEMLESEGLYALLRADVLPTSVDGDQAALEAMGVEFGDVLEEDPLFRAVTLPPGWGKRVGEKNPSFWIEITDEKGHVAAAVFFKNGPHDRRATLHVW